MITFKKQFDNREPIIKINKGYYRVGKSRGFFIINSLHTDIINGINNGEDFNYHILVEDNGLYSISFNKDLNEYIFTLNKITNTMYPDIINHRSHIVNIYDINDTEIYEYQHKISGEYKYEYILKNRNIKPICSFPEAKHPNFLFPIEVKNTSSTLTGPIVYTGYDPVPTDGFFHIVYDEYYFVVKQLLGDTSKLARLNNRVFQPDKDFPDWFEKPLIYEKDEQIFPIGYLTIAIG